jgi:hypothetical protein
MCTVTFIARRSGYCLGMNRDEKLTRPAGLPPTKKKVDGRAVLCPSEPSGGTWIALNDSGSCVALLNWYSVTKLVKGSSISRGEVVRRVSAADSPDVADARLNGLSLKCLNPFRLIGIFPTTGEIVEWCWDLSRLIRKTHSWGTRQWISSGFNEAIAQRMRGETFRRALGQTSARRLNWLRGLHGSHAPEIGPFSTCVHRPDAATVSYTEISATSSTATMRYLAGAPCQGPMNPQESLQLRLSNRL